VGRLEGLENLEWKAWKYMRGDVTFLWGAGCSTGADQIKLIFSKIREPPRSKSKDSQFTDTTGRVDLLYCECYHRKPPELVYFLL
jgi:hypothetical protein